MRRLAIVIVQFLVACSQFIGAQTAPWESATKQEILVDYRSACAWLVNTSSYSFNMKYISYKDHFTQDKIESSEGYYKRVKNNLVTEVIGIKTVQNSDLKIIIDTADKVVTVMNPGNLHIGIAGEKELDSLLTLTRSLKKKKLTKGVKYRIDFNKNELYEAYEFAVNGTGLIESLVYFYSEQTHKETDDTNEKGQRTTVKPRLEISFYSYQAPANSRESEFTEPDVHLTSTRKILLTGIYKDYRLMDYRLQTKR